MKEFEKLAEYVRTRLNLQYDAASVKFIEGFIERNKGSHTNEEREGLINSLGSFLGQCIIENYGGQWQLDEDTNSIAIALTGNGKAFPFGKVKRQFDNGVEDSVFAFYMIIPEVFKLGAKKQS